MIIAKERIEGITTPVLVMGRDEDHLQGIFKTSFDLLNEAGKNVEWVSYDHDYHGYVFPIKGDGIKVGSSPRPLNKKYSIITKKTIGRIDFFEVISRFSWKFFFPKYTKNYRQIYTSAKSATAKEI